MIGFIDSGIGGLSVLKEVEKLLPSETLVYFRDSKNCPYGNKSEHKIYNCVRNGVMALIKIGIKTIVIACNTATAVCIKKLREEFNDVTFIGTEPNIKEPLNANKKNILVLCTTATQKHCKNLQNLPSNIYVLSLKHFAKNIEDNKQVNYKKMFMEIDPTVYDAVVLGCTHYVFRLDELKKVFTNAEFYSSEKGVARRVLELYNAKQF